MTVYVINLKIITLVFCRAAPYLMCAHKHISSLNPCLPACLISVCAVWKEAQAKLREGVGEVLLHLLIPSDSRVAYTEMYKAS